MANKVRVVTQPTVISVLVFDDPYTEGYAAVVIAPDCPDLLKLLKVAGDAIKEQSRLVQKQLLRDGGVINPGS